MFETIEIPILYVVGFFGLFCLVLGVGLVYETRLNRDKNK